MKSISTRITITVAAPERRLSYGSISWRSQDPPEPCEFATALGTKSTNIPSYPTEQSPKLSHDANARPFA